MLKARARGCIIGRQSYFASPLAYDGAHGKGRASSVIRRGDSSSSSVEAAVAGLENIIVVSPHSTRRMKYDTTNTPPPNKEEKKGEGAFLLGANNKLRYWDSLTTKGVQKVVEASKTFSTISENDRDLRTLTGGRFSADHLLFTLSSSSPSAGSVSINGSVSISQMDDTARLTSLSPVSKLLFTALRSSIDLTMNDPETVERIKYEVAEILLREFYQQSLAESVLATIFEKAHPKVLLLLWAHQQEALRSIRRASSSAAYEGRKTELPKLSLQTFCDLLHGLLVRNSYASVKVPIVDQPKRQGRRSTATRVTMNDWENGEEKYLSNSNVFEKTAGGEKKKKNESSLSCSSQLQRSRNLLSQLYRQYPQAEIVRCVLEVLRSVRISSSTSEEANPLKSTMVEIISGAKNLFLQEDSLDGGAFYLEFLQLLVQRGLDDHTVTWLHDLAKGSFGTELLSSFTSDNFVLRSLHRELGVIYLSLQSQIEELRHSNDDDETSHSLLVDNPMHGSIALMCEEIELGVKSRLIPCIDATWTLFSTSLELAIKNSLERGTLLITGTPRSTTTTPISSSKSSSATQILEEKLVKIQRKVLDAFSTMQSSTSLYRWDHQAPSSLSIGGEEEIKRGCVDSFFDPDLHTFPKLCLALLNFHRIADHRSGGHSSGGLAYPPQISQLVHSALEMEFPKLTNVLVPHLIDYLRGVASLHLLHMSDPKTEKNSRHQPESLLEDGLALAIETITTKLRSPLNWFDLVSIVFENMMLVLDECTSFAVVEDVSLAGLFEKSAKTAYGLFQGKLRLQGGNFDPLAVARLRFTLESLKVVEPAPFWWKCGCGAVNPADTNRVRCSSCLKSRVLWTCTKCGHAHRSEGDGRTCDRCGAEHPCSAQRRVIKENGGFVAQGSNEARHQREVQQGNCAKCGTSVKGNSATFCNTCGEVFPGKTPQSLWTCEQCQSFNVKGTSCWDCGAKKSSRSKHIPYFSWKCGCGATNPCFRNSCYKCSAPVDETERRSDEKRFTCPKCTSLNSVHAMEYVRTTSFSQAVGLSATDAAERVSSVGLCSGCGSVSPRDAEVVKLKFPHVPCPHCGTFNRWDAGTCSSCSVQLLIGFHPLVNPWKCPNCTRDGIFGYQCPSCGTAAPHLNGKVFLWKCEHHHTGEHGEEKKMTGLRDPLAPVVVHSSSQETSNNTTATVLLKALDECGFSVLPSSSTALAPTGNNAPVHPCHGFNPSWSAVCNQCGGRRDVEKAKRPLLTEPPPNRHTETDDVMSFLVESDEGPETNTSKEEIRARFAPWNCSDCGHSNGPEAVLLCESCDARRQEIQPCEKCHLPHIAVECPDSEVLAIADELQELLEKSSFSPAEEVKNV